MRGLVLAFLTAPTTAAVAGTVRSSNAVKRSITKTTKTV